MNRESEPPGATKASHKLERLGAALRTLPSESALRLDAEVDASFESTQVVWLETLVNLPSHSPARDDVEVAAAFVEATGIELGLRVQRWPDSTGKYADHRIYSTPSTAPADQAWTLVGHVDTVFPRSMNFLNLRRSTDEKGPGDAIFGPGVLDMKSGLSVIVFALRALRQIEPALWQRLRVRFICNTDEEVGSPTSAALFESLAPQTVAALVFEAGRVHDKIVTQRKGGAAFTIKAQGKAAHSGNDHAAGISAVHALALLIPRIEALTEYNKQITVNVGMFQGGTSRNTVPDTAICEIDTRFATQRDADELIAKLHALAADPFAGLDVPEKLRHVRFEVSGRVSRPPMESIAGTASLREAYATCARAVGLGGDEAGLQGGGSDANLLTAQGVPAIDGLGPFGQYFHQTEEWSSLASLRAKTKALARFLAACALAE